MNDKTNLLENDKERVRKNRNKTKSELHFPQKNRVADSVKQINLVKF